MASRQETRGPSSRRLVVTSAGRTLPTESTGSGIVVARLLWDARVDGRGFAEQRFEFDFRLHV